MLIPPILASILPFLYPSAFIPASPPPTRDDGGAKDGVGVKGPDAGVKTFFPIQAHATHPETMQVMFHNATHSRSKGFDSQLTSPSTAFYDFFASDLSISSSKPPPQDPDQLIIRTKKIKMLKPINPGAHISYARQSRLLANREQSPLLKPGETIGWFEEETEVPDVSDRETLKTMAKMVSNAYYLPDDNGWYSLDKWNQTIPFGWEKDADGLRGHLFVDDTNSTVIISIKGTSAGVLGSGGPTSKNDKFNDNLLFSCCCARVDFSWSTVCDCYAGGYKCEQKCLEESLTGESVYATVGPNLFYNVTAMYPNANIWLTGHSLGGALSALIGISFGAPVVTFEAPAERLAASRLKLPMPPEARFTDMGLTHVYHNADPIPMGVCTGPYSGCYAAGFALETRCHVGQSIIYDTIGRLGWSLDVRTHRVAVIVNSLLSSDWDPPPNDTEPEPLPSPPHNDSNTKSIEYMFYKGLKVTEEREVPAWASWLSLGWWPRRKPKPEPGDGEDDGGKDGEGNEDGDDKEPTPEIPEKRNPNAVPRPEIEDECVDCFRWEFGNGMKKDPTTTSTITLTSPPTPPASYHYNLP